MVIDASLVSVIIHRLHLLAVQKGQAGQLELKFYNECSN